MSETIRETPARREFTWPRALTAGVIATVVITLTMLLTGTNIMKMLGSMMLPDAGVAVQYAVGGAIHLMIGLFYGVVYAWLVGRVSEWNRFVKGGVYGLAITGIALAVMPVMEAMMGGSAASNPCGGSGAAAGNPCQASGASNPCAPSQAPAGASNPCAAKNPCTAGNPCAAKNPCAAGNPCAAKNPCAAGNPCVAKNPCADKMNPCSAAAGGGAASNACHTASGANPCGGGANPCNPCAAAQEAAGGVLSLLNHLVFGLTLAFAYGRAR